MEARRIKLIVGLGNPGRQYERTRHNAGFDAVDALVAGFPPKKFVRGKGYDGEYWRGSVRGSETYLLKPMTFMNLSGESVEKFMRSHKVGPSEMLLVYDDLDIPVGRLRMRAKGSSGGHNGVESVIARLSTENFARLRIGIGSETAGRNPDFVLSRFLDEEARVFARVLGKAADAMRLALFRGLDAAMNSCNGYDAAKELTEEESLDKNKNKEE